MERDVGTDKREIYSKSVNFFDDLKIIVFIVDLLKGLIVSAIKASTTSYIKCININDETRELAALSVAAFILFVIIHIKAYCKCTEDKKRAPSHTKSNEVYWYYFSNFLMVGAVLCYFLGDNLKNFYKIEETPKNFRIASQVLLIIGVLGFRYVPIFKGYLYKYYNKDVDPETTDDQTSKCAEECIKSCIELDDRNIIRRSIVLLPEADAIYSLFENIFTSCSEGQKIATLIATLAIPLVLTPFIGIQTLSILSNRKSECKKWLKTIITTIITSLLLLSFMLSDNQMVLNCLGGIKCVRINNMNELNALNVTCNTTHISNDLFNRTSSEIVIGTECNANSITRIGLQTFEIILMTVWVLFLIAVAKLCKDKRQES